MPNSTPVTAIAVDITAHSCKREASIGISTRIAVAAMANTPRIVPITEALKPRSWPSTGKTKVCTSQHDESIQLMTNKRRICGTASRSQAREDSAPSTFLSNGNSGVPRTQYQDASGSTAITAKAVRNPAWSMSNPAEKGPKKLETDGAMASQLKICLSCVLSFPILPTCRCRAITAQPVAPPQSSAVTHNTGKTGQMAAIPTPRTVTPTLNATGRWRLWRSA